MLFKKTKDYTVIQFKTSSVFISYIYFKHNPNKFQLSLYILKKIYISIEVVFLTQIKNPENFTGFFICFHVV